MMPFYQVYIAFTKLLKNPLLQYSFKLNSGDFIVYNNHLMMHARTAFTGTERFLRGIYMDIDQTLKYLEDEHTQYEK